MNDEFDDLNKWHKLDDVDAAAAIRRWMAATNNAAAELAALSKSLLAAAEWAADLAALAATKQQLANDESVAIEALLNAPPAATFVAWQREKDAPEVDPPGGPNFINHVVVDDNGRAFLDWRQVDPPNGPPGGGIPDAVDGDDEELCGYCGRPWDACTCHA